MTTVTRGIRDRWNRSFAGACWRRADDLDLATAALALGAQEVLCTAPLLVALSAVMTRYHLGYVGGFLDDMLGLDPLAAGEVRRLFVSTRTPELESLLVGLAAAAVFYVAVAATTGRVVDSIWRVDNHPWTAWGRRVVWVAGQLPMFALALLGGRFLHVWHIGNDAANLAYAVSLAFAAALFHWWGHHLLLEGRVRWLDLAPGSAFIGVGVLALGLVSPWVMPAQIRDNVADYGLIGAAFVLSLWAVTYSAIVVYGTLFGQVLMARHRTGRSVPPERTAEPARG